MKCKEIELLLPDFVLGNTTEEVELHLNKCHNCKTLKDEFELTFAVLKKENKIIEPSPEYFNNFLPRLRNKIETKREIFSLSVLRPSLFSFSSAAAILIVAFLFNTMEPVNTSKYVSSEISDEDILINSFIADDFTSFQPDLEKEFSTEIINSYINLNSENDFNQTTKDLSTNGN